MTPEQLQIIKTEVQTTNPAKYAGKTDVEIAVLFNAQDVAINIDEPLIDTYKIYEAITLADYNAMSTANKNHFHALMALPVVNTKGVNTRDKILSLVANPSTSRTNLMALVRRKGSRAEELGLPPVSHLHVAQALRGDAGAAQALRQ